MNILNPNYVDPVLAKAAALTAKINTYFAAHPGVQSITADQIRAQLQPADAADLTDAMMSHIAMQAGWKVTQ